jgi:aryl-alcohol dehydrogenase-like predicted oxidoreductase
MGQERIALGTVQFGLNYGIANFLGQVTLDQSTQTLDFAKKNGIRTLDTAVSYGQSESILGSYGVSDWDVITKIPAIPENIQDIQGWVIDKVECSLKRLNLTRIYGIMLHEPDQILEYQGKSIFEALNFLKNNNICEKIGLSIYDIAKVEEYVSAYDIDLVQAPLNIFDRRLIDPAVLHMLKKRDIEIHARSIFLQGLLLLKKGSVIDRFSHSKKLFDEWYSWLNQENIDPVEACLKFVLQIKEIDRIVIGVQDVGQLQNIILIANKEGLLQFPQWQSEIHSQLINPVLWNIKI